MTHDFKTPVTLSVYKMGADDIKTDSVILEWTLFMNMNYKEVVQIAITPKRLKFNMEWVQNTHQDLDRDIWDETNEFDVFDIDLTKGDWKVSEDIEIFESIRPERVEIDFDTKTIEIV
jgi:hypothetical protein